MHEGRRHRVLRSGGVGPLSGAERQGMRRAVHGDRKRPGYRVLLVPNQEKEILLQLFYGMSEPLVVSLLAPIALFNATQALINIIPAYLIYLRISREWFSSMRKRLKQKEKAC